MAPENQPGRILSIRRSPGNSPRPTGKEKAGGRQGGRRSTAGQCPERVGPRRVGNGPAPDLRSDAPEGLAGLELDVARAEAKVADRALVETRKLVPLASPAPPRGQDL